MHPFFRSVLLGLILLGYIYQVERVHPEYFFGQFQDDSIYFSTAKSLADGQGYTLASFPGRPPETKYPIVYPWLLSFVWNANPAFPDNLKLAIRVTELFGCWSLIAGYFLLRKLPGLGESAALWLTAIFALQPVFVRISGLIMSDVPFMAVMFTALALSAAVNDQQASAWRYLLIGMFAGLSVGIRTVGVSLAAGICCAFLARKAYRPALIVAAGATVVALLVASPTLFHRPIPPSLAPSGEPGWDQVLAYYTSYTRFQWQMGIPSFGALLQLVRLNLFVLASSPGLIVVGTFGKIAGVGAMLLSFPMWIGLVRQSRHPEWKPITLTLLFYGLIVLVWPYPQPERFLLPFIPFLLAGLWCEVNRICAEVVAQLRSGAPMIERVFAAALACALLSLASMAIWNALVRDPRARQSGAAVQARMLKEREQAYQWIREHTKPEDRVAAWKDVVLFLYAGRQSLRPIAVLPQVYYLRETENDDRDLLHICDAPRHAGVRYWMTTTEDFNLEARRDRLVVRMTAVGKALPVVFRSSEGSVQIHEASCLNERQLPECRAVGDVLFPSDAE
jgi:Dolichyl-phosphate-mannose-protein mannosyltransferase